LIVGQGQSGGKISDRPCWASIDLINQTKIQFACDERISSDESHPL